MRFALRRHPGFTLIEALIVCTIMAVLAATIVPQVYPAHRDRKLDSLHFKIRTLRAQIQLYRADHQGTLPSVRGDTLPQLTRYSDARGNTAEAPDSTKPYGPYISGELPRNPFDRQNRVVEVTLHGVAPIAAADDQGGWQYDPATGELWPNNPEYYVRRAAGGQ